MSDEKTRTESGSSEALALFLPDGSEVPRTIFACACALAYCTLAGMLVGHADLGFVVGAGAACGLGAHRAAMRRDWPLRGRIPLR